MAISMRERIAKLLYEQNFDAYWAGWDNEDSATRSIWLEDADAVLAELASPTDGMVEAHAKCEATEWDKRPFEQLGRAERDRYIFRGADAFAAAISAAREGK